MDSSFSAVSSASMLRNRQSKQQSLFNVQGTKLSSEGVNLKQTIREILHADQSTSPLSKASPSHPRSPIMDPLLQMFHFPQAQSTASQQSQNQLSGLQRSKWINLAPVNAAASAESPQKRGLEVNFINSLNQPGAFVDGLDQQSGEPTTGTKAESIGRKNKQSSNVQQLSAAKKILSGIVAGNSSSNNLSSNAIDRNMQSQEITGAITSTTIGGAAGAFGSLSMSSMGDIVNQGYSRGSHGVSTVAAVASSSSMNNTLPLLSNIRSQSMLGIQTNGSLPTSSTSMIPRRIAREIAPMSTPQQQQHFLLGRQSKEKRSSSKLKNSFNLQYNNNSIGNNEGAGVIPSLLSMQSPLSQVEGAGNPSVNYGNDQSKRQLQQLSVDQEQSQILNEKSGNRKQKQERLSLQNSSNNQSNVSYIDERRLGLNDSSLLSANGLQQFRKKGDSNFYGKFIQVTNANDSLRNLNRSAGLSVLQQQQQNSSQSSNQQLLQQQQMQQTSFIGDINSPFETSIEAIRANLTAPILTHVQPTAEGIKKPQLKFKKIDDRVAQDYEDGFDQLQEETLHARERNASLVRKLFSIVKDKAQIVIHESQNKDLMHPNKRKEVVALAKWYEEMSNSVYTDARKLATYSESFEQLQVIHQACLQELTRQVTLHCSERGQLFKRVWETLMEIMSEAFVVQRSEKVSFKKQCIEEIQRVHQHCIQKIECYIPLIAQMSHDIQKKEDMNTRVLLEFRYLRKKNHNLEKSLKESKRTHKQFKADYNELAKQLEDLRISHTSSQQQHLQEKEKMQVNFIRYLEEMAMNSTKEQNKFSRKLSGEVVELKSMKEDFEKAAKLAQVRVSDAEIDELEEKAQKREFTAPRDYYAERTGKLAQGRQSEQKEAGIKEREGLDGIKLFLMSTGVQVGDDLIRLHTRETQTITDRSNIRVTAVQTNDVNIVPYIIKLSQSSQTPDEWKEIDDSESVEVVRASKQASKRSSLQGEAAETTVPIIDKIKSDEFVASESLYDSPVYKYLSTTTRVDFIREIIQDEIETGRGQEVVGISPKSFRELDSEQQRRQTISEDNNGGNMQMQQSSSVGQSLQQSQQQQQYAGQFSIGQSLKPSMEGDITDLHQLMNSQQAFVEDVFEKILKHDLLKESEHLDVHRLREFLDDSSEFKMQENLRFKNIWNKCKTQLIDFVKQKISLHEKEAEVEQANVNLDFGHSLYKKLVEEYNNVLDQMQLQSQSSKGGKKKGIGATATAAGRVSMSVIPVASASTAIDNVSEEGSESKSDENDSSDENNDDEEGGGAGDVIIIKDEEMSKQQKGNEGNTVIKLLTPIERLSDSKQVDAAKSSPRKTKGKTRGSVMPRGSVMLTPMKDSTSNATGATSNSKSPQRKLPASSMNLAVGSSPTHGSRDKRSSMSVQQGVSINSSSNIKLNNSNEDNQNEGSNGVSELQQSPAVAKPRSRLSKAVNLVISSNHLMGSGTKRTSKSVSEVVVVHDGGSSGRVAGEDSLSGVGAAPGIASGSLSVGGALAGGNSSMQLQVPGQFVKKVALESFSNQRFKKHKLKKKYTAQSSANAELASSFFSTHGMKIMQQSQLQQSRGGKLKGPIFTEPNVRKYISSVYNEKIKQTKSLDRSNALHVVTYDFFLNKFGFRKLAEKNLQQLLRSLMYHSHLERVKVFVRFYGLDMAHSYDKDDFNFYVDCLISLDDNLPPIFQQMSIYAIPRVIDLLYKSFETRVSGKVLQRIKVDIESMKFVSADPNLKNKNVIDQDLALQCLLQAKQEEKKVNIIALRPVYLAGDIDGDEVIGQEEFAMLTRNIEKHMSELSILQIFFGNTDMIDEVSGEKTLSFSQFAQVSVENSLFTYEKHHAYAVDVASWDSIRSLAMLWKYWKAKRDILRLRFVKANAYKNFYRLMVARIDEYFIQAAAEEEARNPGNAGIIAAGISGIPRKKSVVIGGGVGQVAAVTGGGGGAQIVSTNSQNSLQLSNADETVSATNIQSKAVLMASVSNIGVQAEKSKEELEKQQIIWLIYRLLDDESKRVLVQSQVDELVPQEFLVVSDLLVGLAKDNKLVNIKVADTTQS